MTVFELTIGVVTSAECTQSTPRLVVEGSWLAAALRAQLLRFKYGTTWADSTS
jgi:hypothetical protein